MKTSNMKQTMNNITVNGKEYPFKEGSTLASVLDDLNITLKHMAIEQNGVIIPGESITDTAVNSGDTIEIIQFVGGG